MCKAIGIQLEGLYEPLDAIAKSCYTECYMEIHFCLLEITSQRSLEETQLSSLIQKLASERALFYSNKRSGSLEQQFLLKQFLIGHAFVLKIPHQLS